MFTFRATATAAFGILLATFHVQGRAQANDFPSASAACAAAGVGLVSVNADVWSSLLRSACYKFEPVEDVASCGLNIDNWHYALDTDPHRVGIGGVGNATESAFGFGYQSFFFECNSCPDGNLANHGVCQNKNHGGNGCNGAGGGGGGGGGGGDNGVGNPINAAWGNKTQSETDYQLAGGTLRLQRFYASQLRGPIQQVGARWGAYWQGTYDRGILFIDLGTLVAVQRPEGQRYVFNLSNGSWVPDADVSATLTHLNNTWRYVDPKNDDVEIYDARGRLTSITSRAGVVQTMTYSDGTTGPNGGYVLDASGNPTANALPAGYLIRVTDSFGHTLQFGYDANKRTVILVDPAGGTYHYGYDSQANLTSVTYPPTPDHPSGTTRQYLYDEAAHISTTDLPHALTGIIDENGDRYATYKYDAQGRAISTEHASGGIDRYTLQYNGDGTSTVTDPLGTVRTYTYETVLGMFKNTNLTEPCTSCGSSSASQDFDGNGNLGSKTDFNGNVTTYSYDLLRNLETSRTEAHGTAQARTITTSWNTNYRLPTEISEYSGETATGTPLRITTMTYDGSGNLLTKTIHDPALNLSRTWTYSNYTSFGKAQSIDGPRTDVSDVTTISYYPIVGGDAKSGQVHTITDALGHVTSYDAYDANGHATTITDANGVQTSLVYDARQRLTSRSIAGATTRFEYDGVGQLKRAYLADNTSSTATLTYSYDAAHRLTDITDPYGNYIHYTLDKLGNRKKEETFDSSNTLKKTHSQIFDALSRLRESDGANGQATTFEYDDQGNLRFQTVQTPDGDLVTQKEYDALNRLYRVTDAASGVTRFEMNALDQTSKITDPKNLETKYTFNALGDLRKLESPDTGITEYGYDTAGNRASQLDARGVNVSFGFDALNRVTSADYPGSAEDVVYQYDGTNYGTPAPYALGRLSGIVDVSGSVAYFYNARGTLDREVRTIAGVDYTTQYNYDAADRIVGITYPTGRSVSYTRNLNGQITKVTTTNGASTITVADAISYLPFGPAKNWTLGNGITASRDFDQDYRLAEYQDGGIQHRHLHYDARDNIEAIEDFLDASRSQAFGYDALSRLTSGEGAYGTQAFTYDAVGNRLTSAITPPSGALLSSTYNYPTTSHRLSSITGANAKSFSYDNAGNTTGRGSDVFTYNNAGRLSNAAANGYSVDAIYDAAGHRRKKTVGTAQTLFFYDSDGNLITELGTNSDVTKREYIWLNGQPLTITGLAQAGEAVVDNGDSDFAASGSWTSSAAGSGFYGADYLTHGALAPAGTTILDDGGAGTSKSGVWLPVPFAGGAYGGAAVMAAGRSPLTSTFTWTIPASGRYRVYTRWVAKEVSNQSAQYTIVHAGGSTNWFANQRVDGGVWKLMGTFDFTSQAVITLTANMLGLTTADAVRLVPAPQSSHAHAHWSAPGSASYEVFARWPSGIASSSAPVTIESASGTTELLLPQNAGGGTWHSLGTYSFSNVATQGVNLFTDPDAAVAADAIRFVPSPGSPSMPVFAYVHTDQLGTPQALTNSAGTTIWDAVYAPFGEVTLRRSRIENPLRFPGQYADAETGLFQNWHREYDSTLGRYIESDPIGLKGGLNTYAYVGNNPIRFADPTGLTFCSLQFGLQLGFASGTPPTALFLCIYRCEAREQCPSVDYFYSHFGHYDIYNRCPRYVDHQQ